MTDIKVLHDLAADTRHARQISRRHQMAELIAREGVVRIEDLTTRFGVSLMTAHRDLDDLATRGLIVKSRGLVAPPSSDTKTASASWPADRHISEKRALALAASRHLAPNQTVFLDDSTTVFETLPHLAAPLTVITHSLTLMNALRPLAGVEMIGLGGRYRPWSNAFLGPETCRSIARLHADLVIMSPAAISHGTMFHHDPDLAEVKRAMFERAARRILLADHSKFTRRALYATLDLRDFDVVISDTGLDGATAESLRQAGVTLELVAP